MALHFLTQKSKRILIASCISLIVAIFLVRAVDWQESIRIFRAGVSPGPLFLFAIMAFVIILIYGYRWRLLLDRQIQHKTSFIASTLCLGGNMFLPVRGGDLLRVHYSHIMTKIPHAKMLSRLFIEKVIDLVTIAAVGVFASVFLNQPSISTSSSILEIFTLTSLTAVLFAVILVKYFDDSILRWLHPFFKLIGKTAFLERHIAHLVRDASRRLTLSAMLLPGILTLLMWLSVYAPSYILVARLVGVTINYQESLTVLFAGALGLMLPAAPSGVGTFHASVVSAFLLLGRSSAEGLLVGTAIHFLFFIAYALPAAILYGRWRLDRKPPN